MDVSMDYIDPEIPPIAYIEGIDLVTEGVLTLNRVVKLLRRYVSKDVVTENFFKELDEANGASMVAQMLIEDCTELHLFVGPGHQQRLSESQPALRSGNPPEPGGPAEARGGGYGEDSQDYILLIEKQFYEYEEEIANGNQRRDAGAHQT